MMGNWGEFGWWGMGFGFLFMALFWVLIVLGIVALIRWLMRESQSGPAQDRGMLPRDKTPLEIVQERYARGEIDRDEYEQKRRDLE
ncbi:SHOCT domain-containing protein [Citrobacter portucalensis]|uniref:SHOCT domain-containing protein n=1 Tax=Citrobacter freundii TaxID=546 RepID=UPI000C15D523|nr:MULTISPECIES: SHOCT domain-containing protein [Citrobacter freundii complex]MEB1083485.1 SHOCT domain-containing protein [Citrobacter portucalensis]PHZ02306.1 electron transporter RnfE [Citrobacter freundii]